MKKQLKFLGLIFALLAFVFSAPAQKINIDKWPDTSKKVANTMMDKYGQPDEQTSSRLIWNNTGQFIHTIVYRDEVQHDFPMPHKDVLEQIINYNVPADKFDDLANYDGSVIAERTKGTLAARCDKEAANFLALNLANDIVEGKKTVDEAREYYANAIMQMLKGEKDDYLTGLQFNAPNENVNNPDKTVLDMSKVKEMKNN